MLLEEFLTPMGLTQRELADAIAVSPLGPQFVSVTSLI
jgi:plasmid maintenance system antidote protein VapI